jgi:ketosteroid isomerase-like protein
MTETASDFLRRANAVLLLERDLKAIPDFFAEHHRTHLPKRTVKGGPAAVKRVLRLYERAFRIEEVEVEILVASNDRVAWRRDVSALHVGRFRGFPATKRPIAWRDFFVSRFEKGRIVEDWVVTDLAERLLEASAKARKAAPRKPKPR